MKGIEEMGTVIIGYCCYSSLGGRFVSRTSSRSGAVPSDRVCQGQKKRVEEASDFARYSSPPGVP